ncbi:MerR family transcriptional regulator [Luteipulveratus mongoliensis]|uniref:MerR family transcriptional regulator n=1 Tax=Luteipulveratus mongoliensis TaxID=571913 RepID=UPI0006980398|nr:MerR family transcriptional regulator [Luteipulveratus mongoliensis]
MDELMTIGRFARISGLSVHTLRHYDDVGLLTPAQVDPESGYRRYSRDQVRLARLIQSLRWIDLPIDRIRNVIQGPADPASQEIFARHRDQLERTRRRLDAQVRDVNQILRRGLIMSTTTTGVRPVQLKITVDDLDSSIAFYQKAFDLSYDVTRRTSDTEFSSFLFGEYGQEGFFLLHLLVKDGEDTDAPRGPSTFGLMVDDLDDSHSRALSAGGREAVPPRDPEGMPRSSAVTDPSGNWIWLYQA